MSEAYRDHHYRISLFGKIGLQMVQDGALELPYKGQGRVEIEDDAYVLRLLFFFRVEPLLAM